MASDSNGLVHSEMGESVELPVGSILIVTVTIDDGAYDNDTIDI